MYAYINGILEHKDTDSLVVEAGGVGYNIYAGARTLSNLPPSGEKVKVYTYFSVREDAMLLYGFLTREEKSMFEKLISVNGVGPKAGMSILGTMTVADIAIALVTNDAKAFAKAPGVGKRIAERLVLELKEKVGQDELSSGGLLGDTAQVAQGPSAEAIQALLALGYSSTEAARAISKVPGESVEELIMGALKMMDKR